MDMYYTQTIEAEQFGGFDRGWGNGYVAVPKSNPAFGKDYNSINWQLQNCPPGGLTFGRSLLECRETMFPDIKEADRPNYWVFGFDTDHMGDNLITCPKEYVENEPLMVKMSLIKLAEI